MKGYVKTVSKRVQGKLNEKHGKEAEQIVMQALSDMGFKCVEKIEVGYKVLKQRGRITAAFPIAKVSGDIRAVGHRGQAVHVESKFRPPRADGRTALQFSDFEPHQIDHMQAITEAGGVAFVAWVVSLFPAQLFLLEWPVPIRKGKALSMADAVKLKPEYFGFKNGNPV